MKRLMHNAYIALTIGTMLVASQAPALTIEFVAGEGYVDGDLITNNALWNALPDGNGPNTDNLVDVDGAGHDSALGLVRFGTNEWSESIYSNAFVLSTEGDTLVLSSKFQYQTTGNLPSGQSGMYSLTYFDTHDTTSPAIRIGLRRFPGTGEGLLRFFLGMPGGGGSGTGIGQDTASETNLNLTVGTPGTSPWLLMTTELTRGATASNWTVVATLSNLSDDSVLLSSQWNIETSATFSDDPDVFPGLNGSRNNAACETSDRVIDTFTAEQTFRTTPTVLIGGTTGDGDFEFPETPGDPAAVTGAVNFPGHPNWYNASGFDGTTLSRDDQTLGSPQSNSRAAMPFQNRKQVNNTGYTVKRAGVTFNLGYSFGRVGGNFDNDESMRTFLFTADAPVDDSLAEINMTEFAEVIYTYPTNEFWTSFLTNAFYTTTEVDIGKTFYFGMEHLNPGGADNFPRLDVVVLTVDELVRPIIRGATGDGDFEFPETPGDPGAVTNALWYTFHPNWFNATSSEGINFSQDTQTAGSSQPDSRAGMPFQNRKQVNNTGYTVVAAGQSFDLSYAFGRVGANYDGDESMRTFLFTADAPVDGFLAVSNMTEFAEVIYDYPTNEFWTTFSTNGFYTTTAADVGKTFYLGMEHQNPGGPDTFPRIDVIQLDVSVLTSVAPSGPILSILRNGTDLEISWDSESGSSYQLQANIDLTTTNWTDVGSAVPGDGNSLTNVVPVAGDELFIRATVQ